MGGGVLYMEGGRVGGCRHTHPLFHRTAQPQLPHTYQPSPCAHLPAIATAAWPPHSLPLLGGARLIHGASYAWKNM